MHAQVRCGGLEFPLLWAPVHGWEAADVQGFLGEEAALVQEPELDGADLLDVWLGESRNHEVFWVTRVQLMSEDYWQVTECLLKSYIGPPLCPPKATWDTKIAPFAFLSMLQLCFTTSRAPAPYASEQPGIAFLGYFWVYAGSI